MESQTSKEEISFVLQLSQSPENSGMIIDEESILAPVIIEELEESEIRTMDVDINEFVEAKALEVCQVTDTDEIDEDTELITDYEVDMSDNEDNRGLTQEEEVRWVKRYINGEVTFSEYSKQIFVNNDEEAADADEMR